MATSDIALTEEEIKLGLPGGELERHRRDKKKRSSSKSGIVQDATEYGAREEAQLSLEKANKQEKKEKKGRRETSIIEDSVVVADLEHLNRQMSTESDVEVDVTPKQTARDKAHESLEKTDAREITEKRGRRETSIVDNTVVVVGKEGNSDRSISPEAEVQLETAELEKSEKRETSVVDGVVVVVAEQARQTPTSPVAEPTRQAPASGDDELARQALVSPVGTNDNTSSHLHHSDPSPLDTSSRLSHTDTPLVEFSPSHSLLPHLEQLNSELSCPSNMVLNGR